MTTQSLESRVREALIEESTKEFVKYANRHPNYRNIIEKVTAMTGKAIVEFIASTGEIDEEEKKEMLKEYKKEILPQVREQMNNPEKLRETMKKQLQDKYISTQQLKAKMNSELNKLRDYNKDLERKDALKEKTFQDCEESFKELYEYAKNNDKFIRKLAVIAKKEGLEVAIQKDTRYKVVRELFPTPADYRTHANEGTEKMRKVFTQLQNSFMASNKEIGQLMGNMLGIMSETIEKGKEMAKKLQGDYTEKLIREIYGKL